MPPKLYADQSEAKTTEKGQIDLWQERINLAKKSQDDWAETSGAKRFIKEYKGDYGITFTTRKKDVKIPPINEVFAYVQSDIATTYNRDPYIAVNAKAGSTKGAALWEVILNYYWRELKTKEELEYEIIDKDLVGLAWHKVGFLPSEDDGTIYSKFVEWKDVVWNIGSKRPPEDCQWMAHRIVVPLTKVKKDFPTAKGLEGVPMPEVDKDNYNKSSYKDDIKVAVLWEVWDKTKMEVSLVAEGLKDRYLRPPQPWPEYLEEFPFLMYWDFAVPGEPRPMSAIAPWEAQLLEEMVITGSAVNHAKRWNRQLFYNGGVLDDEVMDKFERGDDGAILKVNGKVGPEDMRFSDFGQLPVDFYLLLDRLANTRRSINGQPEFSRGGVTKTGTRTVGELNLMQQGNKGRQDRKVDRLETHCENISRHMMAHIKANFDLPKVLKITGETPQQIIEALGPNFNPQTQQVTFTPEEIKGDYDVDGKAGSTLPLDKQTRIQVLETVLQSVAQATSQGPMSPFLNELIQEILRDYDIKGLEEAYQLEQQQAQAAQQKAQADQDLENEKTKSESDKRQAQAEQIMVETAKEGQEVALGPLGRATLKRAEKPEPTANGVHK